MADWQPLAQARPRVAPRRRRRWCRRPPAAITPPPSAGDSVDAAALRRRRHRPRRPPPTPAAGADAGAAGANSAAPAAAMAPPGLAAPPGGGRRDRGRDLRTRHRRAAGRSPSARSSAAAWQLVSGNFGLAVGATVVCDAVHRRRRDHPLPRHLHRRWSSTRCCMGGLYRLFLKLHRGEPAEFGDAFSTFSTSFLPLFLFGLVQIVLIVRRPDPGLRASSSWAASSPSATKR